MKQEKGITLIALVITIIVLLILAGVTIAMIAGNDSAPQKAAQAKVEQTVGAAKDTIAMNAAELMTNYYDEKYVSSSSSGDNYATPQAYITAKTNVTSSTTTTLFSSISNVTVNGTAGSQIDETAHTFVIRSNETVTNEGTNQYYWVQGTVNTGGTITWTAGKWAASLPSFTN